MNFITRQINQISIGGMKILVSKFIKFIFLPYFLFALIIVLFIRILNVIFIIRIGYLLGSRLGHFALNTELYLCEQLHGINKPHKKSVDLFFISEDKVCNEQLEKMLRKQIIILPKILLEPIYLLNKYLPNSKLNEIGFNSQWDRDINNLLSKTKPFLKFSNRELIIGNKLLGEFGLTLNDKFVCLNVRDEAYLNKVLPGNWTYHNHRNSDINDYIKTAEKLADLGYFVFRMGVHVKNKLISSNPKIIDYPFSKLRSEFLDIYLGAKCEFCLSVGSGFDAIPIIFRRPTMYVNCVPIGYIHTFTKPFINLCKRYFSKKLNRELKLKEIFLYGLGFSPYNDFYQERDIVFLDNSPEEIMHAAIEMHNILIGSITYSKKQLELQEKFWKIFPVEATDTLGVKLHGEIYSIYSTYFLENNQEWLL